MYKTTKVRIAEQKTVNIYNENGFLGDVNLQVQQVSPPSLWLSFCSYFTFASVEMECLWIESSTSPYL